MGDWDPAHREEVELPDRALRHGLGVGASSSSKTLSHLLDTHQVQDELRIIPELAPVGRGRASLSEVSLQNFLAPEVGRRH
jgi:hypothetical protein